MSPQFQMLLPKEVMAYSEKTLREETSVVYKSQIFITL